MALNRETAAGSQILALDDPALRARLAAFLGRSAGGAATIRSARRLQGGAIQENWFIELGVAEGPFAGVQDVVLRASSSRGISYSHTSAHEFALLVAARAAGVTVPEPLWLCEDEAVVGRPFFVMRRVSGLSIGRKIVRDAAFDDLRDALAVRLGEELARIHSIVPGGGVLDFLSVPEPDPARAAIDGYRAYLDSRDTGHPVIEWGLRWAECNLPPVGELVLCHRDFRTGNYMVDASAPEGGGLSGILDWEFAGWGAALADVAWFCAKCWRFGVNGREAGGIAARETFYDGYTRVSGRRIDADEILFWEVMAHLRWAVIAVQQAERHISGGERSLELAAIGRRPVEMELEVLLLTGAA